MNYFNDLSDKIHWRILEEVRHNLCESRQSHFRISKHAEEQIIWSLRGLIHFHYGAGQGILNRLSDLIHDEIPQWSQEA